MRWYTIRWMRCSSRLYSNLPGYVVFMVDITQYFQHDGNSQGLKPYAVMTWYPGVL
jgi:hypothetical protein